MAAGRRPYWVCAAVARQATSQSDSLALLQLKAVSGNVVGLSADAGSFSTTGGPVLAIVSLILAEPSTPSHTSRARLRNGGRRRQLWLALAQAAGNLYRRRTPVGPGRLTAVDFSEIFLGKLA